MIGYVRDAFKVHPDLADALKDMKKRAKLGDPTPLISIKGAHSTVLYKTTHKRLFHWQNGQHATPIDMFHSWHNCE